MEQIVTIELFGEIYKLKADSEVSDARDVAGYLAAEVDKVSSGNPGKLTNISKFSTLLVASLNISKEYFDLKERYEKLENKVASRSIGIIDSIDDFVSVDDK